MRRSAAVGSVDRDAQRVAHQGGKGQSWSDRMLGRQQLGLAFVIGALIGASYILGLKQLVQSTTGWCRWSVLLLCLIQFSEVDIRPETRRTIQKTTQRISIGACFLGGALIIWHSSEAEHLLASQESGRPWSWGKRRRV